VNVALNTTSTEGIAHKGYEHSWCIVTGEARKNLTGQFSPVECGRG